MQSMPFSLSIPSHGCIVAHAGLVPGLSLPEQDLYDLIEAGYLAVPLAGMYTLLCLVLRGEGQ